MPELEILRPWWLLAAPVGLALVAWAWRRTDAGGPWRSRCDAALLARLTVRSHAGRPALAPLLAAAAVLVGTVALCGPSWSRIEQPVYRSERATIVVLDLSRSMDASDVKPSRLARARFKIADLLERNRDGLTGLVVYAGDAFVVAPLTDDAATLTNLLPALATELMPVQGSRADLGLERAGALLGGAGARDAEVVLVSDGADDPRAVSAARALAEAGHRVSVLAVGSARGAPIPLPGGGFLTDRDGNIVVPGLDAEGLATVARAGRGVLVPMTADGADLEVLRLRAEERRVGAGAGAATRTSARWEDRGPWLVLALLPLAAVGFRRGWLLVVALIVVPPTEASGADLRGLWARADQRAAAALERGDAAEATRVAPDARWLGPAHYRQGAFGEAAAAYRSLAGAEARYNEGNALARAGRLRDALAAYDRALEAYPEHEDAAFNRAIVEALLEQQQQQQGGGGDSDRAERNQDGEPGGGGGTGEDTPRGEQSAGEQAPADQRPGESGPRPPSGTENEDAADGRARERGGDESTPDGGAEQNAAGEPQVESDAEAHQAMEQWMRRIPDDPGGLLRRKFALEHRRRGGAGADGAAW